ncbi:ABC transporter substrate-binding protein [Leucobacter sp. M11]|uniref:ABC transporter substrate-binding protein n=1 Tax=Leucobacter sp. M11 TaxID=2993565 RepID=UPI002D7E4893|nr:ABC transporter substrate-binding protein [Leucobacter sp. M11]MEB4613876.1 ABC transporter substrate-binding protein [Leucobacter sp. M11]
MSSPRSRFGATLALMTAAALALAGCSATPAAEPDDTAPASSGGFPVTLEHDRGQTVIPERPERVVSLSVTGNAYAQAAGTELVGFWPSTFGEEGRDAWLAPFASAPEAIDLTADFELDFEQIAALKPDLILATDTQTRINLDEAYEKLSGIAPTLVAVSGDLNEQALAIGQALGNEPGVQQLLDDAAAAVADAKQRYPGIAGTALAYGQISTGELAIQVDPDLASSVRFFTELGFTMPETIVADYDRETARTPGTARYSWENAEVLDAADLVIIGLNGVEETEVTGNPVFTETQPFQNDAFQIIPIDLLYALQMAGPFNTEYLLERLDDALATTQGS